MTGGAEFIGSHVVNVLVQEECDVTVLDNLDPRVHGTNKRLPIHKNGGASYVIGDVQSEKQIRDIVTNVDAIIHLAAEVGVGGSMCEIERYVDANACGTVPLLRLLITLNYHVERLVCESSMSAYGEQEYC